MTILLIYLENEAFNTSFHLNLTYATNYDDAKEVLMQNFLPVDTLVQHCKQNFISSITNLMKP